MLGGRAGWRIPSYSVDALLIGSAATGLEGEMLDRQYAYLSPSYARYAMHIDAGGTLAVNLRWLADIAMELEAAGVKLSDLADTTPFGEPQRKAPRFVALRDALESVRSARTK